MNFLQQFISKLSETEKKLFYIALPIVIVSLYVNLLVFPAFNSIEVLEEEISQHERTIKSDMRYLTRREQIAKEGELLSKFVTKEAMESKDINKNFLGTVEKLSMLTKVNIIKSNPTENQGDEEKNVYYANVDCSGPMQDMIAFMHSINSTDELLKIVRFKLSPKRGQDGHVNASMTISKLVVMDEEAAAADPQEPEPSADSGEPVEPAQPGGSEKAE